MVHIQLIPGTIRHYTKWMQSGYMKTNQRGIQLNAYKQLTILQAINSPYKDEMIGDMLKYSGEDIFKPEIEDRLIRKCHHPDDLDMLKRILDQVDTNGNRKLNVCSSNRDILYFKQHSTGMWKYMGKYRIIDRESEIVPLTPFLLGIAKNFGLKDHVQRNVFKYFLIPSEIIDKDIFEKDISKKNISDNNNISITAYHHE